MPKDDPKTSAPEPQDKAQRAEEAAVQDTAERDRESGPENVEAAQTAPERDDTAARTAENTPAAAEDEAEQPSPPPNPMQNFTPRPWYIVALFVTASMTLGLSMSLEQGFLSAESRRIAGEIGASQTQAIWLLGAFMAPRASLSILLIKMRTQFGLKPFAIAGICAYICATVAGLFIDDLHSAIVIMFITGIGAAPLASIAFLCMIDVLPPARRLQLGLPIALTFIMGGMYLARVIGPELWDNGGWQSIHLFQLGLILIGLPLIIYLPMTPMPKMKVINLMDLVSYSLIAIGFGSIVVSFAWVTTAWWTDTLWLGWALAAAAACLTLAVVIELNRKVPLIDIRWLASPPILHLAAVLLTFRIVLSEQSTGAPYMFTSLGLSDFQLEGLFGVITLAYVAGGAFCAATLKPDRVPYLHALSLLLIVIGAYMDSQSTVTTRPEQMYLSQGMIAFAGALFMPSAMAKGLILAFAKGPQYLLSFIVVFLATQSMGGIIGSGVFRSFIRIRTAFHSRVLNDGMMAGDPTVTSQITSYVHAYSPVITDSVLLKAEAASQLATQASNQATVMAYNDAFLLTSIIAAIALVLLIGHLISLSIRARLAEPATA